MDRSTTVSGSALRQVIRATAGAIGKIEPSMRRNLNVSLKQTAVAVLFGSALASLPMLAQESALYKLSPLRSQRPQMNAAAPVIPDFGEESSADEAAYEEREFIQHLNGLS